MVRYKFSISGATVIAFLSLIPGNNLPDVQLKYLDLFVHFLLYLIWTLLILSENTQFTGLGRRLTIMMLITAYGGLMEILQEYFIPGRFGAMSDFNANMTGVLSAGLLFAGIRGKTQKPDA